MPAEETISLTRHVDMPYEDALDRIKAALKDEGFGVLTEIDVRDTLQQKISADFRPYAILGACNPALAHRALQADLEVGLLLPCNVIVYEDGDGAVISVFNPDLGMRLMHSPALDAIASEAKQRLERALAAAAEH